MKIVLRKNLLGWSGLAAVVLASAVSLPAAEDLETVISRARAFIGTEAALEAVNSLRFRGIVTADTGDTHTIEIIIRRPMQQLVTETAQDRRIVDGLDDYTAWRRIEPLERPGGGRLSVMSAPFTRLTRANVAQTLYYYRNLEAVGGTAAVEGEEEVDGVLCVKTVFTHPGNIQFVRFFEKQTGRLVLTRSTLGAEVREVGEMTVAGIRFPKELTTTIEGKVSRVTFEEIRVNEEFPDSLFAMPMPRFEFGPSVGSPAELTEPAPTITPEPTLETDSVLPELPPLDRAPAPAPPSPPASTPPTSPPPAP